MRRLPCLALAALLPALPLGAQTPLEARIPVYGQVIGFPLAFGVEPAFRTQTPDGFFISEWVPDGETPEAWTQMQTLTGHQGVGHDLNDEDAARMGEAIAVHFLDGYRQACAVDVDAVPMPLNHDPGARASFGAYMGCAHVSGSDQSEEMVILVMVGATDSYTLQWAERGPARETFDREAFGRWRPRLDSLSAAHLCRPAAGEPAPYPSCD